MLRPSLSTTDVELELKSLLELPEFRRNKNASAFIKFVVEETLAGRGDRLKAFTIATLALQRDSDFDPQTNSIVRVQATRVRQMLETYYNGAGSSRPVHIVLPRGSYMPVFVQQDLVQDHSVPSKTTAAVSQITRHILAAMALMLAVGTVIGALVIGPLLTPAPSVQQPVQAPVHRRLPLLQVVVSRGWQSDGEQVSGFLEGLAGSLGHQLSAFDHLAVVPMQGDSPKPDYILSLSHFGHLEGGDGFGFQLIHPASGSIVWTMNRQDVSLKDPGVALRQISSEIVVEVGDIYGALFTDWAKRSTIVGGPLAGAACIYEAAGFLRYHMISQRAAARACLERELETDAEDASAEALLVMVLLRSYAENLPDNRGLADVQRALQLARRGFDRAPHRARAQFVLFLARFFDQRFEDAFQMGEQALASNPNASVIKATVGAAYVSRGRLDEGIRLLIPPNKTEGAAPGHFASYIALADYLKGDLVQFDRWAMRQSGLASPLGLVMRLLAYEARHDGPGVFACWRLLQADHPGFAADIKGTLLRQGMTSEIVTRLDADLGRIIARDGL